MRSRLEQHSPSRNAPRVYTHRATLTLRKSVAPTSLLHTLPSWSRQYADGWFEVREGRRQAPSPSLALDSAFPRMNGGYSGMFPIVEDSASLATPLISSGVSREQKSPPAGTQVLPARDPFLNSSGVSAGSASPLRAHEHPIQTSTASVEQVIPTLPVKPVVTPQPPST